MRFADQEGGSTIRTGYNLSEEFQCHCEPTGAKRGKRVSIKFKSIFDDVDEQNGQANVPLQCEIIATVGRDFDLLSK